MAARKPQTARLRKCACPMCGFTVRVARSWLLVGVPECPCGEDRLWPTDAADLAFIGELTAGDMPVREWNAICRVNGWDIIRNKGQAAQAARRASLAGERVAARSPRAHCSNPGCGAFAVTGTESCNRHAAGAVDPGDALPF